MNLEKVLFFGQELENCQVLHVQAVSSSLPTMIGNCNEAQQCITLFDVPLTYEQLIQM